MDKENIKAGAYLGGLWGPGLPGSPKGAPKRKKKGKEKKQIERKKERKKRKRREKERKYERKRGQKEKIKVGQHDERGAMQFEAQAGAQGKKTSGAPN